METGSFALPGDQSNSKPSHRRLLVLTSTTASICLVLLGDDHTLLALSHLQDLITRADRALLDHAKVKAWPPVRNERGSYLGFIHPDANAITSDPRLRYFEDCVADTITVADTDSVVWYAFDCEIFFKLTEDKIVTVEILLPVTVRLELTKPSLRDARHCGQLDRLDRRIDIETGEPCGGRLRVPSKWPCGLAPHQATSRGRPTFTEIRHATRFIP